MMPNAVSSLCDIPSFDMKMVANVVMHSTNNIKCQTAASNGLSTFRAGGMGLGTPEMKQKLKL